MNASLSTIVHHKTLANGLTILCQPFDWCYGAACGFFVKTGARDEKPKESGVSHFLEHMLFKGTPKRSAIDLSYAFGEIGAKANAFTSGEMTVYFASVLGEYLPQILEIQSDMLQSTLPENEFITEKKVILEEIALYQDRPQFYLFEKALRHFYQDHSAGNSVLGTTESVGALEREQMSDYYTRRYTPSNMVLVAAGCVDWEQFHSLADEYCGAWRNAEVERELKEHQERPSLEVFRKKDINQAHVLFMTHAPSMQDDLRYDLQVLATIMGDSQGSRLYWSLVHTGIAEYAFAESDNNDGTGTFSIYAVTRVGDIDRVSGLISEIANSPLDLSEEDLERARNKLLSRIVLSGESPMGRMMALGQTWHYSGKIHRIEELQAKIKSVTKSSIADALNSYTLSKWYEYRLLPA